MIAPDYELLKVLERAETHLDADFTHAGFRCVVLFVGGSHGCGYVRIPEGHPAFSKDYDDVDIDVHGGLTFKKSSLWEIKEEKGFVWFGFDCSHAGDWTVRDQAIYGKDEKKGHFWTKDEVVEETKRMAEGFAMMEDDLK